MTIAMCNYVPNSTSDIIEVSRLVLDNADFSASIADAAAAKKIYLQGKNSCGKDRSEHIGSCDARTLQSLN
jgi:hypothetical protein